MLGARGARLWRTLGRVRTIASLPAPSSPPQQQQQLGAGALTREPVRLWFPRRYSLAAESLFPKEEEKPEEVIAAVPRQGSGKIVSKKARRAGRAPSVVFSQENGHLGGDKRLISVETKQIERLVKRLGKSVFLSTTFDLEVRDEQQGEQALERVRVLPRSIHFHAGTDKLMNVTFIRAPPSALLKVDVPLIFIGEDACPGLRKGGYIYTMMRTVQFKCPGGAIPAGIEVDLSALDMGQKILLKDLKVAPGITLLKRDSSLPVCKVMGSRTSSAAAEAAAAS